MYIIDERDKYKAEQHQQVPWAELGKRDHLPLSRLVGIDPDIGIGGYVLGKPDKQGHQEPAQQDRHVTPLMIYAEIDIGSIKKDDGGNDQNPAHVPDVVMCKKIEID